MISLESYNWSARPTEKAQRYELVQYSLVQIYLLEFEGHFSGRGQIAFVGECLETAQDGFAYVWLQVRQCGLQQARMTDLMNILRTEQREFVEGLVCWSISPIYDQEKASLPTTCILELDFSAASGVASTRY